MTRILLIEDNRDLAYGLRNNLEIEGYDVEVAHDGVAGLRMFSNVKPDLTILDIMLPQLDGFRVLKTLRQKYRHRQSRKHDEHHRNRDRQIDCPFKESIERILEGLFP